MIAKAALDAASALTVQQLAPLCTVGWVNLYQKFEIEKYTVFGKFILPKKWKGIKNFFWHNWLADLHGFANICKLPVSNTFNPNPPDGGA